MGGSTKTKKNVIYNGIREKGLREVIIGTFDFSVQKYIRDPLFRKYRSREIIRRY